MAEGPWRLSHQTGAFPSSAIPQMSPRPGRDKRAVGGRGEGSGKQRMLKMGKGVPQGEKEGEMEAKKEKGRKGGGQTGQGGKKGEGRCGEQGEEELLLNSAEA